MKIFINFDFERPIRFCQTIRKFEVWYQTKILTWKNPDSGENLGPYRWLTTLVMTQRLFRKLFSISGNIFQYLEIVSGNSSAPLPEFSEFQILFESLDFGKSFRKIPWVMAEIVKIAFGKKFRKSSWVTTRFFLSSQLWTWMFL